MELPQSLVAQITLPFNNKKVSAKVEFQEQILFLETNNTSIQQKMKTISTNTFPLLP